MRRAATALALCVVNVAGARSEASAQTAPSSSPAPAASAVASQPAPAATDAPIEVSVHGSKRSSDDIGGDAIKAADARATPGTFGDPLQALAALPGIAPMASGLPYFYLRGAPPADTGYFVDG